MNQQRPTATGIEATFNASQILVSKTDPRGVIRYANSAFVQISGYSEAELIGKPHAILRHPDMPACVFKLLWDTLQAKKELFAYVVNLCKDGRHYWVLAHITPDLSPTSGEIVGYHSSRRAPVPAAVTQIRALYAQLRQEESRHSSRVAGMQASSAMLHAILEQRGQTYEEYVFALTTSSNSARLAA